MSAEPKARSTGARCKPERRARAASDAARKQRQSDLLDEALLETFPASDSVSIGHVK